MRLRIFDIAGKWVKYILPFYLFILIPLRVSAQGIPYLRNYTAEEYKGHNQNFDVIAAKDGTLYAANFEGLLYYDNSDWRIIHTPGISRITAVFQDSKGRIWTGGYNYFGYLKIDKDGNLQMSPCTAKHTFQGTKMCKRLSKVKGVNKAIRQS